MATRLARFTQGSQIPVGTVVQSFLTEAQFQAINGTAWVLADGRNVAGSYYATVTGSATIPDVRGVPLRGKNNGRADGNQNPDGELALGAFQGYQVHSHEHSIRCHGNSPSIALQIATSSDIFRGNTASGFGALSTGGNETRMRNVTVNHFVKINP